MIVTLDIHSESEPTSVRIFALWLNLESMFEKDDNTIWSYLDIYNLRQDAPV